MHLKTAGLCPRPGILDITPYVGGKSKVEGGARVIKLSSNESALGPSPRAVEAYQAAAVTLQRYPDGNAVALREAIAKANGLDPERIVCGAGSDELLYLLARGYAGPGDEVLVTEYGFPIYPIAARTVGAVPVAAPETGMTADVDALLDQVSECTRIVYLANPNNPTGTYLPAERLRALRAGLPEGVLLVIDSAYAEFVTSDDYTPGIDLVDANENVVMTRTFSKIHSLAALRLGWAYGTVAIVDVLNRLRGPFNVSGPAQAAGLAALGDVDHVRAARRHNARWLPWLEQALADAGLEVPPSACNFVVAGFPRNPPRDAAAAYAFLLERGIIVRPLTAHGLKGCLRISVGLEDEMRAVAEALSEFMA